MKEFNKIVEVKKELPQEIYIKYLENVIKILLSYVKKIKEIKLLK